MLFAHLKRILRLTRLRLRGPNGANDEFLLAATAQNLGLGVLMGVAPGLTAIAMAATIATRWFIAQRGLVLGILSAATATGQLIFLPPAAWITQNYGWRASLLPFVLQNGPLAVLFILFSRDRPADVGLPPFGEDSVLPDPPPPSSNVFDVSFDALRAASGSLTFWVVTFAFFICGVSSIGLMPHFVTFCGDFGVSRSSPPAC